MKNILGTILFLAFSAYDSGMAYAQSSLLSKVDGSWYTNAPRIRLSDLPPEAFKQPANGNEAPSLVLDGTTFVIGQPGADVDAILHFKNLTLKAGARIVTNGADIEIDFEKIASKRGVIQSFEPSDLQQSPPDAGRTGRAGLSGGHLILHGEISNGDTLTVNLPGQNGQQGGAGRAGANGVQGAAGDNAADHLFDCARGGGIGGQGTPGQDGEDGHSGGRGGDGGTLTLRGALGRQSEQVYFSAPEGLGGEGGIGGDGGAGGAGGPGGRGSTYCGGGSSGQQGEHGHYGRPGHNGDNGNRGHVILQPGG